MSQDSIAITASEIKSFLGADRTQGGQTGRWGAGGIDPGAPAFFLESCLVPAKRSPPAPLGAGRGGGGGLPAPAPATSLDTSVTRRHFRVSPCGKTFRVAVHKGCGARVFVPVRCGDRFRCPDCARIAAARLVESFRPRIDAMTHPLFLTLTTLSVPAGGLSRARQGLLLAWGRLRHRKLFEQVRGGVWAVETTYSQVHGWHLHLHAIIDSPYLPQAEISRVWEKLTGARVVDIREVKDRRRAAKEVLKYVCKPWELDADQMDEVAAAFKGQRKADSWGTARAVGLAPAGVLCCPRCGEPVRWSEWEFSEVSETEARQRWFGVLWADCYSSWTERESG